MQQRWVPQGARKVQAKAAPAVIYVYEMGGKPCAIGYFGKSAKPVFGPFHYRSEAQRAERVGARMAELIGWHEAREAAKAKAKAKRAEPHKLQAGHILVSSWGYEQTNIDFYRVEKLIGSHMVELVKIPSIRVQECGYMQGKVVPDVEWEAPASAKRLRKRVDGDGVKIASYAWAHLWSGRMERFSEYA